MHDTENPVPRNGEGRRRRPTAAFRNVGIGVGALGAGAGIGYAGLKAGKAAEDWQKSSPAYAGRLAKAKSMRAWAKVKAILKLQSELREIQLAAGDYARKYLIDEPLLARPGDPGFDPGVEREVKAALLHRHVPELSERAKGRVARQLQKEATHLKSGFVKTETPLSGKRFMPMVKIVKPYKDIRGGISRQRAETTKPPKPGELPPPEFLPPQKGKIGVHGSSTEVGAPRGGLWDYQEAAKPTNIKYIYPEYLHPHDRPKLSPEEVSIRGRQYRDPIASHRARVEAGMTPDLTQTRESPVAGLPERYLPKAVDVEERRKAQVIRDTLAHRLRSLRSETITPMRDIRRKYLGLRRGTMSESRKQKLWAKSEAMGDFPIAPETLYKPHQKPKINPMVPILPSHGIMSPFKPVAEREVDPRVIHAANQKLRARISEVTKGHQAVADSIRQDIHDRLQERYRKVQSSKLTRETSRRLTNETFHPNRVGPGLEDWEAKNLAEDTGTSPEWIHAQHKEYSRRIHLTTGLGEKKIRRAMNLSLFKGIAGAPEEPVRHTYPILKSLGKRVGIGAGIAGALGVGAYAAHKLRKRKETRFAIPEGGAFKKLQGRLKGLRPGRVGKHEVIVGGALAGGITAADALTSAVFPDPEKSRKESALAGAKRGAVYGTALAGAEPLIRIPLTRHFLKRHALASRLREIQFQKGSPLFRRIGNITIVGKPGHSEEKISGMLKRMSLRQPHLQPLLKLMAGAGKMANRQPRKIKLPETIGGARDRFLSSRQGQRLTVGGTYATGSKGKRTYINRASRGSVPLREIAHHEGFHTIPVAGYSEIAAHYVGRAMAEKGKFRPVAGLGGIGHLIKTRPVRAGLEISPLVGTAAYIKHKSKEAELSSILKEIRFQEWSDIPSPGRRNRKLSVAQDRYKKIIREHEIQRKEANLAKSAVAGAALAGVLHGRLKVPLKHALIGGGVAGLGTQAALIARGRRSRDPYGEESIASKRIERIPYQAGGLAAAGIVGHQLYRGAKKAKLFSSRNGRVIRFQQFIPSDDPTPYHQKLITGWIRHPKSRVEKARKWIGRAQRAREDIGLPKTASGEVITERGRVRQAEWQKPYVKRALYTGAAIGGLGGLALLGRHYRRTSEIAGKVLAGGARMSDLSQGEKFALNVTSGNWLRAIRAGVKSKFPKISSGMKRLGGVRGELHNIKEDLYRRGNKAIEERVGAITGATTKMDPHTGEIAGVSIINPAKAKEDAERLQAHADQVKQYEDKVRKKLERVKASQKSRAALEKLIKPPEEKYSSRVKEIRFQGDEPGYVKVKPHYRKPRSPQPRTKRQKFREGALIGTAIAGTGLGVGGGIAWDVSRRRSAENIEKRVARRLAEIAAKNAAPIKGILRTTKVLSARLDDIISFK